MAASRCDSLTRAWVPSRSTPIGCDGDSIPRTAPDITTSISNVKRYGTSRAAGGFSASAGVGPTPALSSAGA